jgi:hypothetical protein
MVEELLTDFKVILISDFYPAYDSLKCRHQKCWVHLIRDLNDDLYKLMSPYLDNRHDATADKISSRISQEAKALNSCSREAEFNELIKQVESFEKITGVATSRYAGLALLKDELTSYKKLQDDLINEMIALDYKLLDKKEVITYVGVNTKNGRPLQNTSKPMSIQDILNFPAGNLSYFEGLVTNLKKERNRKEELYNMQDLVAKVKAILNRQKELKVKKIRNNNDYFPK